MKTAPFITFYAIYTIPNAIVNTTNTIEHPITKEKMTFEDLPEPIGTWCILKNYNNE